MPISQLASSESAGERSKTFVFEDEGHTLGNTLRSIISSYKDVQFCGYTISHPAEKKMNLRIQMYEGRAVDALRRGLEDLVNVCDHTLDLFENELTTFKKENNIES
ncbi:probable DNA-directed RNA polymerases I and III subunit RPAC2 [Agrilus planipennis]|uniref:DNA-directed RNA polymerases I and III subunit RPAC2 n=1 Tax=Agrilus planipennis TaxID=224129 RepID=A0A1W4WS37_AGRPL|nr:probable DNA-directed RNA polymerases I and III subunit RPAC2 [Agrilus planipennis]